MKYGLSPKPNLLLTGASLALVSLEFQQFVPKIQELVIISSGVIQASDQRLS